MVRDTILALLQPHLVQYVLSLWWLLFGNDLFISYWLRLVFDHKIALASQVILALALLTSPFRFHITTKITLPMAQGAFGLSFQIRLNFCCGSVGSKL
jgi:hypothetical protein